MASSVPGRNEQDRNQEATVYMGNLDEKVTDAIAWELMLQAGPVTNVHLPRDRVSMTHQGFGFCEFATPEDAEYACKIMNQIKLYGKPIRVNMASSDRKPVEIGANLFIGSLDPEVNENLLHTAFSNFGTQTQPARIARDDNFVSKGHGFVYYDSFEAADQAIESMNGQYLMNKPIVVQYAYKKDGKGERHGSQAERLLAAQARKNNAIPQNNFAPPPPPSAPFMPPTGFSAPPGLPGMPSMQQPGPPPGFGQQQQQQQQGFVPPPPPGFM